MDIRPGNELALEEDDGLLTPDHFEARPRAPGEHRVHGGFESHGAQPVAGLEQGIRAGGELLAGVLARVAHHVRRGGAEGMHAALLEPEHRSGHRLHEARRLLHAGVGHHPQGHALARPEGAIERGRHLLFLEAEGDERRRDCLLIEHAAAVQPDHAHVEGDGEGLAVAVKDGASCGPPHLPA